jgi:hypothetical protein
VPLSTFLVLLVILEGRLCTGKLAACLSLPHREDPLKEGDGICGGCNLVQPLPFSRAEKVQELIDSEVAALSNLKKKVTLVSRKDLSDKPLMG